MGGDEVVADWLGDTYAVNIVTTGSVQRLSSVSKRFRSVNINNFHDVRYAYIGKYHANSITFASLGWFIAPSENIHFEFVDLYELGCLQYLQATELKILGINEY